MSSSKWWAFIQSFDCNKCASASSYGFPENSGLKFNQFKCRCLWLHLGVEAGPVLVSDWVQLFLPLCLPLSYFITSMCCIPSIHGSLPFIHPQHDKSIRFTLTNFSSSQMLEFDDFCKLVAILFFFCELETFSYLLNFLPQKLLLLFVFGRLTYQQFTKIFNWDLFFLFNILDACPVENFNPRDSFFLILESQMSLHVMYSSAGCK